MVAATLSFALSSDEAYCKAAQAGEVFRSVSGAHGTAVFISVPVAPGVASLNASVTAVQVHQALGISA